MTEHPVPQPISAIQVPEAEEGAGQLFAVGRSGVTRIEATTKSGIHADIPYVRVWKGDVAVAEFCQHQIIGVYFTERLEVAGAAMAGNTGAGELRCLMAEPPAKLGVYKLTIVEPMAGAGGFVVEDPDGAVIGCGDVGVPFVAAGLAFFLPASGAPDFAAGDQFAITVAAAA